MTNRSVIYSGPFEVSNPTRHASVVSQRGQSRLVSVDHYENFPVASVLCPPALRPAIAAIYGYARTADDLADEGEVPAEQRLADLAAYRADLQAIIEGRAPSARWAPVFNALRSALQRHALPTGLLADLLSAFEQDVVKHRYADRPELLDYCRRSANPVGRLLLHLYGIDDAASLRQSDSICTALQLANFWQDVTVDLLKDRVYIPLEIMARHGYTVDDLFAHKFTPAFAAVMREVVDKARALFLEGLPLSGMVDRRLAIDLDLFSRGGMRVLRKIEQQSYDVLAARPKVSKAERVGLLLGSVARVAFSPRAA